MRSLSEVCRITPFLLLSEYWLWLIWFNISFCGDTFFFPWYHFIVFSLFLILLYFFFIKRYNFYICCPSYNFCYSSTSLSSPYPSIPLSSFLSCNLLYTSLFFSSLILEFCNSCFSSHDILQLYRTIRDFLIFKMPAWLKWCMV